MRPQMRGAAVVLLGASLLIAACGTTKPEKSPEQVQEEVRILKLEAKAQQLVDTTQKLDTMRGKADELRRRLTTICVEYPDHDACSEQTAAHYARAAFCADKTFTSHVDEVVKACHQGACKQVDEARLLKRAQYMTLIQRLPHALVLFGTARTKLDRNDKKQLQQFLDQLEAEGGYLIIVGRASKDGPWRKNLKLALSRAEETRQYLVDSLGYPQAKVGYITYGHEKMYLTELDAARLTSKKISLRQANRSALIFAYPCHDDKRRAAF